jgi:predicted nucleotidyltransferase
MAAPRNASRDAPLFVVWGTLSLRYERKELAVSAAGASNLLEEMTRAVVEAVHPEQVLVFGSHARGDATADSDVDLLVVEKEPFDLGRSRRHELRQIRRALSRFPVPKDVLVYSRDEVERWKASRNHIIRKAYREGKVLYDHE